MISDNQIATHRLLHEAVYSNTSALFAEFVIIIPVYKHSVLIAEAVESALAQTVAETLSLIIVNDGCPNAETHQACLSFALSFDNVVYINKPNGGPSSARNEAIEFVLSNMANARAVYFLDADNRLSRNAISHGWSLLEANGNVGWIYPNISGFEIEWSGDYAIPYSRLLHIVYDNICDTGSLVRIDLLRKLRFNTDERSEFEDWDFWLSAIAAGYVGMPCDLFGLNYRIRPESRNKDSIASRQAISVFLRKRYKDVFTPRILLNFENEESPRIAFFDPDMDRARLFSDPANPSRRSLSASEFVDEFAKEAFDPQKFLIPNVIVIGQDRLREQLAHDAFANCVFWRIERKLISHHAVIVTFRQNNDVYAIEEVEIGDDNAPPQDIHLLAVRKHIVNESAQDVNSDWLLSIDSQHVGPKVSHLKVSLPSALEGFALPRQLIVDYLVSVVDGIRERRLEDPADILWNWRHSFLPRIDEYPRLLANYFNAENPIAITGAPRKAHVGIVVPFASFGGAEKAGYATAAGLRKRGFDVHLFVVGDGDYNIVSEYKDVFSSIHLVGADAPSVWGGAKLARGQRFALSDEDHVRAPLLRGMLAAMDVVINCHSTALNTISADLRRMGKFCVSYLHVFDRTYTQREIGHPFLAVLFEHAYDLLLTCSHGLRHRLHGMGIPVEKILTIPNAPSFVIADEASRTIREARRMPARELRIAYVGRMDFQKGMERIIGIVESCRDHREVVSFRFVGANILENERSGDLRQKLEGLEISIERAVFRSEDLQSILASADVLILPSRWEGAPLIILEAQQAGCIPVATDVGAVGELIEAGVDGILVPDTNDLRVVADFKSAILELAGNPEMRKRMALAAMDRVAKTRWETSVSPFADILEARFSRDRGSKAPEG